ncbi:MAG: ATP-binding protein [Nitrospinota bacterium]
MNKLSLIILSVALAGLVFLVDLNTELGVAGGVPYIIVVALGLFYEDKRYFIYAGGTFIFLTLLGFYLSPAGGEAYKVYLNRFYAVMSITVVSYLGYIVIKKKEEFENLKANFDERINIDLQLAEILSEKNPDTNYQEIFDKTIKVCLDNICSLTQWSLGHLYLFLNDKERLLPTGIWSTKDHEKIKDFIEITESTSFDEGVGLPGRVLKEGKPVFIPNLKLDTNFPRLKSLNDTSLVSAFAVPLKIKGEFRAVLEFFSESHGIPNSQIMEIVDEATLKISRFIERSEYEKEILLEKNKAEEANQAKSKFLAKMSHELRTPLNAILGFSQLMKMKTAKTSDPLEKDNLDMILSAGDHLLSLIDEILDLSIIESGKLSLSMETQDIVPIVDNVISVLKPLAHRENISLEYKERPRESYYAQIDSIRFKQVIFNLISNAVKYNKKEGSVIVSLDNVANSKIKIGIKDTGIGIPEEKRDKIFEPFERLGMEGSKIEGSGIGLTISKQLVSLMGGTIGYENLTDGGSHFYVVLPISFENPVSNMSDINLPEGKLTATDSSNHKILYVEDIPANFELVKQILSSRKNLDLLWASNARDGIEKAKAQQPDLILMDIHLPDLDGISAFKAMKDIEAVANIPVVALSADAMAMDINRALKIGFAGYITKPLDIDRFLEKIDEVI